MPLSLGYGTPLPAADRLYVLLASIGILLTVVVLYLGKQLRGYEQGMRILHLERDRMLEQANANLQEIQELKDILLTVCAWTSKIRQGDKWISASEFLSSRLGINVSHSISPEAMAETTAELSSLKNSSTRSGG